MIILLGLTKAESQAATTTIVRANPEPAIIAAQILRSFTQLENREVNWVAVVAVP